MPEAAAAACSDLGIRGKQANACHHTDFSTPLSRMNSRIFFQALPYTFDVDSPTWAYGPNRLTGSFTIDLDYNASSLLFAGLLYKSASEFQGALWGTFRRSDGTSVDHLDWQGYFQVQLWGWAYVSKASLLFYLDWSPLYGPDDSMNRMEMFGPQSVLSDSYHDALSAVCAIPGVTLRSVPDGVSTAFALGLALAGLIFFGRIHRRSLAWSSRSVTTGQK
jgi:hypothetical protein